MTQGTKRNYNLQLAPIQLAYKTVTSKNSSLFFTRIQKKMKNEKKVNEVKD
jgi:hypothetical protein